MTNARTPTEKSKTQRDSRKTPPNIWLHNDCGQLRKVSHPTGVVKVVYERSTFEDNFMEKNNIVITILNCCILLPFRLDWLLVLGLYKKNYLQMF